MFAQIAVDTYHDPTKKLFSYEIPKKFEGVVEPGDLVKVPFGKRMVAGFVYQISTKKPTIKTKPIKALKEKKVFTPNQITNSPNG
ncbi:hypothetical protein GTO10_04640 [Candidatus Saccharibacteria bacterium]|nr:hypothetical protein [Candidatus Saccharibacteria bacterium]